MAKSRKQPATAGNQEDLDSRDARKDAREISETESDNRTNSSGNPDNEVGPQTDESPLSRPKGMDAWFFYYQKLSTMQEIIQQLISKAGLSQDQATKAIQVIGQFVKDKYPMAGGYVDNFLGKGGADKTDGNPLKNFLG